MQAPPFIQHAGVLESSVDFSWKGKGMHFGPEQGTKLHEALQDLTVCGQTAVAARVLEWLIWRFSPAIDVTRFLDYVDSVFAWTVDWRYHDDSAMKGSIPKDTPINQALGDAVWMLRLIADDVYWRSPNTRDDKVSAIASITKQTLPANPKKAFSSWLTWAVQRARDLSPKPPGRYPERTEFATDEEYADAVEPFIGLALPREALDPDKGYKPEQREELLSRFIEGLDWKKNPFLRSPEDMKKLNFPGTPYRL